VSRGEAELRPENQGEPERVVVRFARDSLGIDEEEGLMNRKKGDKGWSGLYYLILPEITTEMVVSEEDDDEERA